MDELARGSRKVCSLEWRDEVRGEEDAEIPAPGGIKLLDHVCPFRSEIGDTETAGQAVGRSQWDTSNVIHLESRKGGEVEIGWQVMNETQSGTLFAGGRKLGVTGWDRGFTAAWSTARAGNPS